MRQTTWTVDLSGHGEFNMAESKAYLASSIAECYGGNCGKASTKSYWLAMPKHTLAVVLAGLQYPLN
jgi:hypothetical protein